MRKIICALLACAMLLSITVCFTGCNTYEQGPQGIQGEKGADGKNGVTPQLRINPESNEWEISYDNGTTWTSLGVKATGNDGADGKDGDKGDTGATIEKVEFDNQGRLIITLTDGTVLAPVEIPKKPTVKESLRGKKISFMGDSISTFEGWSNNAMHNSTLFDNKVMYNKNGAPQYQNLISVHETWWKKTIDELGLELCVNNSYSGSRVTSGGSYPGEVGCGDRAINLHNDNTGAQPDIIVVYMGTNDYQQIGGAVDVDTFARDYALMVKKIKDKYPNADIYLCTLHNYDYVKAQKPIAPSAFNEKIESIAEAYNCNVVDFYNGTGVTPENLEDYTVDLLIDRNDISLVHPNVFGMAKMYECLKNALAENYIIEEAPKKLYTVTLDKEHLTNVSEYPSIVAEGEVFEVSLSGNAVTFTVTVGGKTIDCYDHDSGKIIVPYVTGDIVITAKPYEWLQYLNKLPTELNGATNIYSEDLITRQGYYDLSNKWVERADLMAAIIPVSGGMKIKASSFVHVSGVNKGTVISWFMEDGTQQGVTAAYVYEQQTTKGYVVVPDGAIAVCMVWRSNCAEEVCQNNYMYISYDEFDPDQTTDWSNTSVVFVGDSITASASFTSKFYYEYLKDNLNFSSVEKQATGGSCISAKSDYRTANAPLINRYRNIPDADLIVIFMGTNDFGHATPLGNTSDSTDISFYGALNVILPTIKAAHPNSQIVMITPLHRYYKSSGVTSYEDDQPNKVGATLTDYVDAIKYVCDENNITVIDLFELCKLDPQDTTYFVDGIHPNANGHAIIADIIEEELKKIPQKEDTTGSEANKQDSGFVNGNQFTKGEYEDDTHSATSNINLWLRAGTVVKIKDNESYQWSLAPAVSRTAHVFPNNKTFYPDGKWTDIEQIEIKEDGWYGFLFRIKGGKDKVDYLNITDKTVIDFVEIVEG